MRGVPWVTHVGAMVALTLLWWFGVLEEYGVDTTNGWWDPALNATAVVLVGGVLLLGVPIAWIEAWTVRRDARWGAHLLAVTYIFIAGLVAHFFAGLRFWGNTSPTALDLLVLAWVTFPVMVGLQLLLVRWMTRWPFPTTKRGAGQRWAKKLGLVE